MSQIIQAENEFNGFVETDCKIELKGHEFTSGGAWLCKRKDTGKYGGVLYAYKKVIIPKSEKRNESYQIWVGTWDGSQKVQCQTGTEYRSNFGDMRQSVWFRWEGRFFWGTWYKSNSDIVRCVEITEKSYYS